MQRPIADLPAPEDRETARRIGRVVLALYSSLALALCVSIAVHLVAKPLTIAEAPAESR